MSNFKHTPGPWLFNSASSYIESSDGGLVAIVRSGGYAPGSFESNLRANARLIAAAPELLELLIECRAWIQDDKHADIILPKIDQLLNKIKGDLK